jgi:hypothetical protein
MHRPGPSRNLFIATCTTYVGSARQLPACMEDAMKLTRIEYEVPVDAPAEAAWNALARFVDVAQFHPGVLESSAIGDQIHGVGARRVCLLPDKVTVHECIIDWKDGSHYTYDVYDWKNFPLRKMLATFGVRSNGASTRLYQVVEFRLSPAILTPLLKGKLKRSIREVLLGYKHFVETNEHRPDRRALRKRYAHL